MFICFHVFVGWVVWYSGLLGLVIFAVVSRCDLMCKLIRLHTRGCVGSQILCFISYLFLSQAETCNIQIRESRSFTVSINTMYFVFFLLSDSVVSEFHVPRFWNTPSVPSSYGVCCLHCLWGVLLTLHMGCAAYTACGVCCLHCIWGVLLTLHMGCAAYTAYAVCCLHCIWG